MDTEFDITVTSPTPRLARAVARMEITGNDLLPVDTKNSNIPTVNELPLLLDPKKKRLIDKRGKRTASYQLRYLYKALKEISSSSEFITTFTTVSFSTEQEQLLLSRRKKPASTFGEQLIKTFKPLLHPVYFFLVLERGDLQASNRLHAHMIMSFHPSYYKDIRNKLKSFTDGKANKVNMKRNYDLKLYAPAGSFAKLTIDLDAEYNLSQYTRDDNKPSMYKHRTPVDIGATDYMSKQLDTMKAELKSSPIYAPQNLRSKAHQLYAAAYERQQLMKAQEKAAAKIGAKIV